MQAFPHRYSVAAAASQAGNVSLSAQGLDTIESAPPAEFGGPGDRWSPETLLVASVADCYLMTFKAVAAASKFDWVSIESTVEGVLDKPNRAICFTAFTNKVKLVVPAGTDIDKAQRLLEKAESACLIVNSLSGQSHLDGEIEQAPA